jgi:hypothetical protein
MRTEPPSIELRALIPEGASYPASDLCPYACRVGRGPVTSYGPIHSLPAAQRVIREAARQEPIPWGSHVTIKLVSGVVIHVGRVRWTPDDLGRWIQRSLRRVSNLRDLDAVRRRTPVQVRHIPIRASKPTPARSAEAARA